MSFEKMTEYIYRLKVPFEKIYTAVWLVIDGDSHIVFDAATTREDVERIIVPALQVMGVKPTHLICSHHHDDHSGGIFELSRHFPQAAVMAFDPQRYSELSAKLLANFDPISEHICSVSLPGHTKDMMGLFDERSNTLIAGDALQQDGVDRWGTCVIDPAAYFATLDFVRKLHPERLLTSHDFVPLGADIRGGEAVLSALEYCKISVMRVWDIVAQNHGKSIDEICTLVNAAAPGMPPVAKATVRALSTEYKKLSDLEKD